MSERSIMQRESLSVANWVILAKRFQLRILDGETGLFYADVFLRVTTLSAVLADA